MLSREGRLGVADTWMERKAVRPRQRLQGLTDRQAYDPGKRTRGSDSCDGSRAGTQKLGTQDDRERISQPQVWKARRLPVARSYIHNTLRYKA